MKHFITGGLGVVGSEVARATLLAGDDVVILDACEEKRNEWVAENLLSRFGARVTIRRERMETANLTQVVECDRIVHAAASTGIPHSAKQPEDDWISNVDATRNLLETLRASRRKIPTVILSSVKPYRTARVVDLIDTADGYRGKSLTEDTPLEPDEPYAASKMAQSAIAQAYARTYDLPIAIFRCSNLYGSAPCHGPRHGWLTWFCIASVLEREIEVQGSGKQTRDMLFTSDVYTATKAAFQHMTTCEGQIFNIGGGPSNTISVAQAVRALEADFVRGKSRAHEDMFVCADSSKFQRMTGWAPEVSVGLGIDRIVAWAKENVDSLEEIYCGV
jgi:CDP-paratose 2-epimerase